MRTGLLMAAAAAALWVAPARAEDCVPGECAGSDDAMVLSSRGEDPVTPADQVLALVPTRGEDERRTEVKLPKFGGEEGGVIDLDLPEGHWVVGASSTNAPVGNNLPPPPPPPSFDAPSAGGMAMPTPTAPTPPTAPTMPSFMTSGIFFGWGGN